MDAIPIISPIKLCPINFKAFGALNRIVGNLEETLLLAKIKFHQCKTKLIRDDKPVITRSRQDILSWFGFSQRKTDALLSSLSKKGFLYKTVGTYYGKKQLFLSASDKINEVPVNISLLKVLIEEVGSLKAALVYSKIAFGCARASVLHNGQSYCFLRKEDLSNWAEVSIRTLDSILDTLYRKGLILKKNLVSNGRRQTHFHIPESSLKVLKSRFKDVLINKKQIDNEQLKSNDLKKNKKSTACCKICRLEPAKMQLSIKVRTNTKQTINNTLTAIPKQQQKENKRSDISFSLSSLGNKLNPRQMKYLESALKRTINRFSVKVSDPKELLEQIIFYLTNSQQHKGVKTFQHAVSRCMVILKSGNWKTPIGFSKHDERGRMLKKIKTHRESKWEDVKKQEIIGNQATASLYEAMLERTKRSKKESLTRKGLDIAKSILRIGQQNITGEKQSIVNGVIERYLDQLKELFTAGANKDEVVAYLKANATLN